MTDGPISGLNLFPFGVCS